MKVSTSAIVVLLACVLGVAEQAWAWGPATHIGLARTVLDNLGVLPVAVAAILGRHGFAYLYGSIAADIVFAKRLSRVKQFCHHWSTAFRLLDGADTDRAKAFAYGYLSHLAADTVAHGKFVPHQITVSECTLNFGHLYWELRADAVQAESTWQNLEEVLDEDHTGHHSSLAEHIRDTFLSYEFNRLLFSRMNSLALRQSFRRTMHVWSRYSRWYLSPNLLSSYTGECVDRIQSILIEGDGSRLLREDPNGTSALMQLRVQRRAHRRMRRQGMPVTKRLLESSYGLAPHARYDRFSRNPEPAIAV